MRFRAETIGGRSCCIYTPKNLREETAVPIIYYLTGENAQAELTHILDGTHLMAVVAALESPDWNRDYSPWPAPALSSKQSPFAGQGGETLSWLAEALVPHVAARQAALPGHSIIAGYSLAGLLALWAMYSMDIFDRCGSCSGSLWYDGWADFMRARHPRRDSRIYLSLGRKEGQTKNPRMAAVDSITREAHALLQNDPAVAATTLQWHEGGHFSGTETRVRDALLWLTAMS